MYILMNLNDSFVMSTY